MCGGGRFTVNFACLPAPLLDRLPVERASATSQTPPVSPYGFSALSSLPSSRPDVSTASGSALRGNIVVPGLWFKHKPHFRGLLFVRLNTVFTSCGRRQWNLLEFHARSLADGEICEVRRLFADGFVCEGLHCDPILCACWHDGSETVVLKTLRATLSGSCPDSTASNAVHSDSRLLQYENPRRFPHH